MDIAALLKTADPTRLAVLGAGAVALLFFILFLVQRGRVRDIRAERDRLEGVATRAREILATAPDGIFLWDHLLGGITCSRRLAVLLGLEAGTQARYDDIRAKFDEETLARLERHVSALRGNGTPFDTLLALGDRLLQAVGARAVARTASRSPTSSGCATSAPSGANRTACRRRLPRHARQAMSRASTTGT